MLIKSSLCYNRLVSVENNDDGDEIIGLSFNYDVLCMKIDVT